MLSRLVIIFLPRSKRLLISWLRSTSAVILEPQKIKSDTVSTVSPSVCHEVMGPDAHHKSLRFFFTFCNKCGVICISEVIDISYLRLLIFLPAILIPACAFSSPVFLMMYSYVSIITLNVNGLNAPTKRQRLAEGYKNRIPIYAVYKRPASNLGTHTD